MRFCGKKYKKGTNIEWGSHYKRGAHRLHTVRSAHRLRTVVKSCVFYFSAGLEGPPDDVDKGPTGDVALQMMWISRSSR